MKKKKKCKYENGKNTFTFNHLSDAFIQSDLQMRTIEAVIYNDIQVL